VTGRAFGLIGLGVMGQNLALNFQRHGYPVAVYNRTEQKTRDFVASHPEIMGTYSYSDFVNVLDRPRKIFLMVTAGSAVDATISSLERLLSPADVILDGGNSFFKDTERRSSELSKLGVHYLGVGVSGGEEGAFKGPCIMVGGARDGFEQVKEMLPRIAAQADGPCCQFLGPRGAGHYVKMVHNGIEYAIIQVIAEAYDLLIRVARMNVRKVQATFHEWNEGELNSFPLEIAAEVLSKYDQETNRPLVSVILDRAKQKGTGKWTSQNAMDLGVPTPTIDAAVSSRNLSGLKDERVNASKFLKPRNIPKIQRSKFVRILRDAVQASIMVSYAQGFHLMRVASQEYGYDIPLAEVARIWKGGCIIRAKLLNSIGKAYRTNSQLGNLILDKQFAKTLTALESNWRQLVRVTKKYVIPIAAMNASLDYYDGYRNVVLPANLIQALRDRFGSHGYERTDKPGQFHTNWTTRSDRV
jgi:6-phosphogluconate dehydrogenase